MKIHAPARNLGCLGFSIGRIYFDFYQNPRLGMFIRIGNYRLTIDSYGARKWR